MNVRENERHLSPAETCALLGLTIKALRLYERHGLVAPRRSQAGWRIYGPEQIARLHQVLTLKALGLGLARIAELLRGRSLDDVLEVQERALCQERDRLGKALTLVRKARARLGGGGTLSLNDLTQLAKETTMSTKPSTAELNALLQPMVETHFSPSARAALSQRPFDQDQVEGEWNDLIAEAKCLMAIGDPRSPAALDLARRWKAQVERFTGGDTQLFKQAGAVWKDAMADPQAAPKLPLNPEIFAFMGLALAAAGG